MRGHASYQHWALPSAMGAFAVYLLLIFSHLPLTLSVAIHKSSVHFFKRYKREHALQFTFEEQDFAQLDWKIPNKEFAWKGDMYDVIHLESKDCQKVVICFKDVLETKLLRSIRNTARDLGQHFARLLSHMQLYFETSPVFNLADVPVQRRGLPEPKEPHSTEFHEFHSPPPDVAPNLIRQSSI